MPTLKVNNGKAIDTNLISGLGGTAPNYLGIGSGTNPAAATDTALQTEFTTGTWSGYARVHVVPQRILSSVANDTISWNGSFTAPAAVTVSEYGLFDAATAGNLYIHSTFTGVALGAGDQIALTTTEQMT